MLPYVTGYLQGQWLLPDSFELISKNHVTFMLSGSWTYWNDAEKNQNANWENRIGSYLNFDNIQRNMWAKFSSGFESRFAWSTLQILVARCQRHSILLKQLKIMTIYVISTSRSGDRKEENGLEELKIIF